MFSNFVTISFIFIVFFIVFFIGNVLIFLHDPQNQIDNWDHSNIIFELHEIYSAAIKNVDFMSTVMKFCYFIIKEKENQKK